MAKRKTELGNKINFVHATILKNQLGEKVSQESFQKTFRPITSKLDDVALGNLKLPRKRVNKKREVSDYGIPIYDENISDYGLDDLFDKGIPSEQNKQLVPKPLPSEESLADKMSEGKQIYIDPQYLPPEYGGNEGPDYALDEDDYALEGEEDNASAVEDRTNEILEDLNITHYDNVDKILNQPEMTPQKTGSYLNKVIATANVRRNQLKVYKARVRQAYNKGTIGGVERAR